MKIDVEKLNIAQANNCLTNKELCKNAEVGYITLIEIKNGKRKSPNLKTLGKLAKALNVNVIELIKTES